MLPDGPTSLEALDRRSAPVRDHASVLAKYKTCLGKLRGRRSVERMRAAVGLQQDLKYIQFVLDKAGPAGPRKSDAAGVIAVPPWVKPPKYETREPRAVSQEHLHAAYIGALAMELPRLEGIKPPAWWRALLVVAYNTGLTAADAVDDEDGSHRLGGPSGWSCRRE